MRKVIPGVLLIAALALLAACNSNDFTSANRAPSVPTNLPAQPLNDGVRRINVNELKSAVDKGDVFIVDVRAPEAYAVEHIKGSVNIPETATLSRSDEFPRDKLIVTYCS